MVRTVRIMAAAAILGDRCVFPKVRPALLGMAAEAGVIERLPRQLPVAGFTVSAVTAAAIHLALPDRM